jgi:hypothetical protein
MRWPNGKALVVVALGSSLAGLAFASAPAVASKLSGARSPAYASRYSAVPRWYRSHPCRGRTYTYLAGWGCDYYRYSRAWPKGRR